MPVRWQVALDLDEPRRVQVQHLHHHVCAWLERSEVDHRASSKPFAISPLWVEDGQWAFDIGLLDDALAKRLAGELVTARRRALRFGPTRGCVAVEHTGPVAKCSWDEMADRAAPVYEWMVEFLTPFATRRHHVVQPRPAAQSVFGHLHRRWQEHARGADGVVLPAGPLPRGLTIAESVCDGRISDLYVRSKAYSGFVGTVAYRLQDAPAATARSIDQLALLLPFSGAGTMTTFGMGVARLLS